MAHRIELLRPHAGQQVGLDAHKKHRFLAMGCGRRFGKTEMGKTLMAMNGLNGKQVAWFAPTYKMLGESWRWALDKLAPAIAKTDKLERRIGLSTGGVLTFWSLDNCVTARGRMYDLVIVDEAAHFPDMGHVWNSIIRPTLTDTKGGGILLSTPRVGSWFNTLHGSEAWHYVGLPTTANPYIDPDEVEAARVELPDKVFREEYLAELLDESGAVFQNVGALCVSPPLTPDEVDCSSLVAGLDFGIANDYTVLSVMCAVEKRQVLVWRRRGGSYYEMMQDIAALVESYGIRYVLAESNSMGRPNIEHLYELGVYVEGFTTTASSKHDLIQDLALAMSERSLVLVDDYAQRDELMSYTVKTGGAYPRYGAPAGKHDDTVMALALALRAARTQGSPILI